jgi:hypothetical protein
MEGKYEMAKHNMLGGNRIPQTKNHKYMKRFSNKKNRLSSEWKLVVYHQGGQGH